MTNVTFPASELAALVGRPLTKEDVEERLPMMGVALEGWDAEGITLDVFANHPDWYSVEGLARALRGFLGIETGLRRYDVSDPRAEFRIESSVARVRPFAVGAFVRGLALKDDLLRSLIDLQEKLHATVGRKRRKVAIGIHDADRVVAPFTYRAVPPRSVRFVPLGMDREMDLAEILTEHEKGREYAAVLSGADAYPVIQDARGAVLSFPPIINGTVTQITPQTRALFLDVTGTDRDAVGIVLNILLAALADRGGRLEAIHLVRPEGREVSPDLRPRPMTIDLDRVKALLGLEITTKDAIAALTRMRCDVSAKGGELTVLVPAYRADILHRVDLIEDIAVGHGYERIPPKLPGRATVGTAAPAEQMAELVRGLLAGYGFQEAVTLPLTPREEAAASGDRVLLRNPISEEVAALRSTLLPGLLRLLEANRHRDLPQRLFEVGPVVRGGANRLHVAAVSVHAKAGFTEAKSLVQSLLRDLAVPWELGAVEDPLYLVGRCAAVRLGDHDGGRFGEVHPGLLELHGLKHPAVALEIDLSGA